MDIYANIDLDNILHTLENQFLFPHTLIISNYIKLLEIMQAKRD